MKADMGHSDLINVRERQSKFEPDLGQVFDDRIDLPTDVPGWFGNVEQVILIHKKILAFPQDDGNDGSVPFPVTFLKNLVRQSLQSPGRKTAKAPRFAEPRGGGLFKGRGGGAQAFRLSLRERFDSIAEGMIPGRCLRELRCRSRSQSKRLSIIWD